MQRKPLFLIIPVVAIVAALVLFFQRDNTGQPQSATPSRSQSATGSGANMPPNSSLNPTPSGTPAPADPNNAPTSASQRSPSGEPARPADRR